MGSFSLDAALISLLAKPFSTEIHTLLFFAYFIFVPYFFKGYTLSSKFLSFNIKSTTSKLTLKQTTIRTVLVYFLIYNQFQVFNYLADITISLENRDLIIFFFFLCAIWGVFNLIYWSLVLIKRPQTLYFDTLSKTYLKSHYKKEPTH
ncbi:MAG: hypothetical protein GX753_05825 [Erysipelothrix sp.]|nr:hypothetical protein [Erysipelothrix sp.]